MTITPPMKSLIENHSLGTVATVNPDLTPNLSPKATMVILDENTLIFGNIRSPQTLANIKERPSMEINFVDVLTRRCVRVKGQAEAFARDTHTFQDLIPHFQKWDTHIDSIRHIFRLRITKASLVISPAYDVGETKDELKAHWKAHFAKL